MRATMRRLVRADPDDRWAKAFGRIAVYSFSRHQDFGAMGDRRLNRGGSGREDDTESGEHRLA
jgi:hypothetical protein